MQLVIEALETRTLLANIGVDITFGDGGVAAVDGGRLIRQLDSGKIMVVGTDTVRRLNPTGAVDGTFVDAGADPDNAIHEAIISGNRLYVAGRIGLEKKIFVRVFNLTTGAPDNTFGSGGSATINVSAAVPGFNVLQIFIYGMAVTSDGGLVIATAQIDEKENLTVEKDGDVLYKLTSAGQPDAGFGTNGVIVTNDGDEESRSAEITAKPGGGFYSVYSTGAYDQSIELRKNDGTLDPSFTPVELNDAPLQFPSYSAPFLLSDGKFLLAITSVSDGPSSGYISRHKADGTLDATFNGDGFMSLGTGGASIWEIDSKGRIIGSVGDKVVRLSSNGDYDTTFDDDGKVKTGFEFTGPVDVDSSGRVLVANSDPNTQQVKRLVPVSPAILGGDGILRAEGTDGNDVISAVISVKGKLHLFINDDDFIYNATDVKGIELSAQDGDDNIDMAINIPVTVHGDHGNDTINGGFGNDSLYGDDNEDLIFGDLGRDYIRGGNQRDTLRGGDGNDTLFGEDDFDSLEGGPGNDRLFGGFVAPLTFDGCDSLSGNAGNDTCYGGTMADRVAGNGGRDKLFGGEGNDRILGGASGDWLHGDPGADELFGEGGDDRLYADEPETGDFAGSVDTLHGNAGNDQFITLDNQIDNLFGDGGSDQASADDNDVLTSIEAI